MAKKRRKKIDWGTLTIGVAFTLSSLVLLLSQLASGSGALNLAWLLSVLAIGFFLIVGAVLVVAGLPQRKRAPGAPKALDPQILITRLAGGFLAMAGLMLVTGGMVPDLHSAFTARDWPGVPARVISSGRASKGMGRYGPPEIDIRYVYHFEGRDYESARYELVHGSVLTDGARNDAVRAHPVGATVTCFVNPRKPWIAVVERGIGGSVAYWLIYLVVFGGGIVLLRFMWGGTGNHRRGVAIAARGQGH